MQVVNEGQTVRLPCLVDRLEGFVLLWRKNDRIISVGPQIVDKSTSTIQLEEEENGNTLVISLTDHTDEAEYVCSVSAYRKTEIRHNVRIRVEPVITTSPKEPLTLPEGGSATLSCQLLSGTPIPDLKWIRCDGGNFPNGGKEIVKDIVKFESVTRDHSGCYLCQAQNGFAEEPVTSMATLVVEYPPSVHIKKSEDSSETLTITCTVESHPSPQISWLKNGEIIEDEKKHIVINTHSARSTLNLVSLDETDFGNYTCEAENKFGKDWKSVRLTGWPLISSVTIHSVPNLSLCHEVTVHLYSESSLKSVKLEYRSEYSQYWKGVIITPEQSWGVVHRLCNLTYSTPYWVRVAGSNSYGFSPLGIKYNFTTDSMPRVKLAMEAASSSSLASVSVVIVCFLVTLSRIFV